jgi:hypothetical protein
MLGQQQILLLPVVKSHGERMMEQGLVCATVELEIVIIDGQTQEHLTGRWVGQAVDQPGACYRAATQRAVEDFLSAMFLLPLRALAPVAAAAPDAMHERALISAIRRRPQGALATSEAALPAPQTVPAAPDATPHNNDPIESHAPPAAEQASHTPPQQLKLLPSVVEPVVVAPAAPQAAETPAAPAPTKPAVDHHTEPPSSAWKAANALWRALVSEVVSSEVMDAFESSLERYYSVESWRQITPEQIRECCQMLRKRTAIPSDVRLISDREEYILAQLDQIPAGSSMERIEREITRLVESVTDAPTHERFLALYLHKMHAERLAHVPGRALIALARKLRKLDASSRRRFILDALREEEVQGEKRSA